MEEKKEMKDATSLTVVTMTSYPNPPMKEVVGDEGLSCPRRAVSGFISGEFQNLIISNSITDDAIIMCKKRIKY